MSMLDGFKQAISINIVGSSNVAGTVGDATSQMDRFKASAKSLMKVGGWMLGIGSAQAGFAALRVKSTTATTKALGELFSGGISAAVQAFKTTGSEMAAAISQLGAAATSALVPMEV